MKSQLPLRASQLLAIPLGVVFVDAYRYFEIRVGNNRIRRAIARYQKSTTCPEFVADYALNCLSSRIAYTKGKDEVGRDVWKPHDKANS